ncbi:MAG TPA: SDR family oxidoreductase [Sphingomonas sp.]|uniref:SDR family NAD(P)-dependent oxidoreductase n=1 Tax=Sphingomonas sp. TaxID=28214 RepID=UPI002ED92126
MFDLQDRAILVTGAASGIGRATTHALIAAGAARLVLVDRNAGGLAAIDAAGAAVEHHVGDVSDPVFWDRLDLGRIDHLVASAGIATSGMIADLDLADWRHTLAVNLDGTFLALRAAMRAIPAAGSIVLVASASGVKAEAGIAAYAASKAAVLQLARVAAKEGAPRGLRVNAIAPAGVETPIWNAVPAFAALAAERGEAAAYRAMAAQATPLGRFATAAEIAGQILFLLSDASGYITGQAIISDGGYTL